MLPRLRRGGLAWALSRHRGDGGLWERAKLLTRQGVTIGAGTLVGVAPHLLSRGLLANGLFGLYAEASKDAVARGPLPAWRVPQRFIEIIWLNAYHEAEFFRELPLDDRAIRWLAPVILGSFALLAILHSRAFRECLRGMVPGGERASLGAAFGAPWLVLYPFAYTLATDLNPPSFPWHYYPLYPLLAAAMGLLGGTLWAVRESAGPRRGGAILVVVALAWTPVLLAHGRGIPVPGDLGGHPGRAASRGASNIHLARFLIWNWVPRATNPEEIRDALTQERYDLRAEFMAMLGHSLRGHEPEHLSEPLQGWDRVSFHRGLRLGEFRALVETPSKPNEWPLPAVEEVPVVDACAVAGRTIADGMLGLPAETEEGAAGRWRWFGRGMAVGAKLDKDRTNAIFQGRPSPYGAAAEIADEAGEHRVWYLRGLGYALGRGGILAQHRDLRPNLSVADQARVFEGIAMMRRTHFVEETAGIARAYFSDEAEAGFRAGAASAEAWMDSCRTE